MKNSINKNLKGIISLLLAFAMSLALVACGTTSNTKVDSNQQVADNQEIIENLVEFTFEVVDANGETTIFIVKTDKKTVGEALLDEGLIAGEESEYGLYVKQVNGITADYDVDQTYWAFYINGEYAATGVDSTNVEAGSTYSFKVEK